MSKFSQPSVDSTVALIMTQNGRAETKVVSTPRKPSKGGWNAAIFIIFVEAALRFAYYGLAGNLITYLTNDLHQSTSTAIKNINTWVGVSAIFPIFGAIVADSLLGRFKTILLSSTIYFIGMVLLTLSVSVIPTHYREAVFFIALYILAVGEGGHKPSVQTFAADQFDEGEPEEKAAKSSFFNWWYLGIVVGASSAILVVIYIQVTKFLNYFKDNIGWTAGIGILTGALGVALFIFLIGIKRYRKQAPVGSPFTMVAQVFVAATRKRRVGQTRQGWGICCEAGGTDIEGQPRKRTLAATNQFRFLDKATIIDDLDASSKTRNPWRLCSLNQVEEVKLVLRLLPIWLSCLMFTVVIVQTHTLFIKQGSTMTRSIGPNFQVPPASFQSLVGLTILFTVPFYERVFIPAARKITGHSSGITMLQRIGVGLFLSIVEMVVAALVEAKRVSIAREHGLMDIPKATIPMSVWWILPQYMISGISDVFTVVGLQELFYDQMPESMRSMGAAAYISVTGLGSFFNTAIITVVQAITARSSGILLGNNLNRAHVDYFYWILAALSALNFCVYLWVAHGFVYKKVEGEKPQEGRELAFAEHLDAKT
ncbi:protein NRT1/ PTR FAMILY 5.4-like [Populus alba x Populus x berolinensis]|uniref:Protein NRT1/ PTR FAMILY 5.4-like n=1 Tax=Populus alba x Populus x berolinensis TaxID=444605 RepID=A0AAD6RJQ0_9ROSI|nr:protein NRT1/ PTR FAMILY 5.4-like [Populus alba x Populus x berolinensis]